MKRLYYIYIANLFLGFHYYLMAYVNSSFLLQFMSHSRLDLTYMVGSALNIIILLIIPRFFSSINAKPLTIGIVIAEFFALIGLSASTTQNQATLFFIAMLALGPIIIFCLDLFLEASIKNEGHTGRSRAFFLTSMNIAVITSFGLSGFILNQGSFSPIYMLSALFLLPLLGTVIFKFQTGVRKNVDIKFREIFNFLKRNTDVIRILSCNFLLQFFYSTMVIHLPLLLNHEIGFDWDKIGIILVIMVIPFIIFEIPVGKLIDKKLGEKEFLFTGFVIMAVSCVTLSLLHEKSFLLWTSILFISRIGAAFVEISCESYFFKKVTERNSSIISLFRITQPLSMVVAPGVAIIGLLFTGYSGIIGILGVIVLTGVAFIPKTDSR